MPLMGIEIIILIICVILILYKKIIGVRIKEGSIWQL